MGEIGCEADLEDPLLASLIGLFSLKIRANLQKIHD
jgi:hypothetical protein